MVRLLVDAMQARAWDTWEEEAAIHDDYIDQYDADLEAEAELEAMEAEEDGESDEEDGEEKKENMDFN